jgi:hypothetical protein
MKTAYRVLAGLIALGVAVQAMVMVWAVSGLSKWVDNGGILDKAAVESGENKFPEETGFGIHFFNGTFFIPLIALILLIVSFFAKIPGGVKWALIVLGLVILQVAFGFISFGVPFLGMLHGLNALLLLGAAGFAARRAKLASAAPVMPAEPRGAMPA